VESRTDDTNHMQVADTSVDGEHFIAAENIQLTKGLHYFVFKTIPAKTELYIYMIGEKSSILFPWLNAPNGSVRWSIFGDNHLKPIFSQMQSSSEVENLSIVIYSALDQLIQLRWQHGNAGHTIYRGKAENVSSIYKAELRHFVNIKPNQSAKSHRGTTEG